MDTQIVRDFVMADRLAKGRADYEARRASGQSCPDLRSPQERNAVQSLRVQRLDAARQFVARCARS